MNKTLPKEFYNSVTQAAKLYEKNLEGNEVTFLTSSYKKNKNLDFYTLEFKAENFSHLVGLKKIAEVKNSSATKIYKKALLNNLNSSDFHFTHNLGVSQAKLDVAPVAMSISSSCNLLGQFDENIAINISSDGMVGTFSTVLSFIQKGDKFIPNSVLKRDIRELTYDETRRKILTTVIKDKHGVYSLGMVRDDLTYIQSWEIQKYLKEIGAITCLKACADKNYKKLCSVKIDPNPNRNAHTGVKKSTIFNLQNKKRDDSKDDPHGGRK